MNWQNLKLYALNFIGFLIANPIFLYLIFGFILFAGILGYISSCRDRQTERKIERTKEQILKDKVEANIISNSKNDLENEVNAASTNTNLAINKANQIRNSNSYRNINAQDLERKRREVYP